MSGMRAWSVVVGLMLVAACARQAPEGTVRGPGEPDRAARPRVVLVNLNLSAEKTEAYKAIRTLVKKLAPGVRVKIVHYPRLTSAKIQRLAAAALILGPQSTPWAEYEPGSLDRAMAAVRAYDGPVLGICGGQQFLALAYGGEVSPMECPDGAKGYAGCVPEEGFVAVDVVADDPLFKDIPRKAGFMEQHFEEVKRLPDGFEALASTARCRVQAMRRSGKPVYGVQFHPERYSDSKTAGRQLIWNFLEIAGLVQPVPNVAGTALPGATDRAGEETGKGGALDRAGEETGKEGALVRAGEETGK